MIRQVASYRRVVDNGLDAELLESLLVTDTRVHKDVGRPNATSRKYDFLSSRDLHQGLGPTW